MSVIEVEVEPSDVDSQRNEITTQVRGWSALTVSSPEEYQEAGGFLSQIKDRIKRVREYWKPVKKKFDDAHAEVCKKEKDMLSPLQEAERSLSIKMGEWSAAEEKRRKEEEARLQAEAKKQAEADAKRQADLLKKAGRKEEAKAVIKMAETPPPIHLEPEVPKVSGLSTRKVMKFRVVDVSKLNRKFMKPDEVAVGALVRNLGKSATDILGVGAVEIWEETSFAGRGR